jgi:S1-C subfamily serine protease
VTDIEAESELGRIGVEPGDVIRKINRSHTDNLDSFRQAVLEAVGAGSAVVFIQRGGQIYQVTIGN